MTLDEQRLRNTRTPADLPFGIRKIGHVVLRVSDLARSVEFYTQVLGFKLSDVYPDEMMPGGMVFLRCNGDHHCLALVGGKDSEKDKSLHHLAFEVPSRSVVDERADWLRENGAVIESGPEEYSYVPGYYAVFFYDPDGLKLEIVHIAALAA